MKLSLDMNLDNDAFSGDWTVETIKCLRKVIEGMENGRDWGSIVDTNGNKVGNWDIDWKGE